MTVAIAHPATAASSPASDLSLVADIVLARHRAAAEGDAAALDRLLHPVWCAKGLGGAETRADVLARAARSAAAAPDVTGVQMCFGYFAIVRTDDWSVPAARLHLLFAERGHWRIAGEASVDFADGVRSARFAPGDERAVLETLAVYYDAITLGEAAPLDRVFAPIWQMKNHQDGIVVAEDKAAFMKRIDGRPLAGYRDDRQVADVQIVADRLAYVRVDKPSSLSTTVFLFLKAGDRWSIVDKAWSARRAR